MELWHEHVAHYSTVVITTTLHTTKDWQNTDRNKVAHSAYEGLHAAMENPFEQFAMAAISVCMAFLLQKQLN